MISAAWAAPLWDARRYAKRIFDASMDKFLVKGPVRLHGNVTISGAKNASLALIPACLLAPGVFTLHNTPNNRDVWTISSLLETMGVGYAFADNTLTLDSTNITSHEAPYEPASAKPAFRSQVAVISVHVLSISTSRGSKS